MPNTKTSLEHLIQSLRSRLEHGDTHIPIEDAMAYVKATSADHAAGSDKSGKYTTAADRARTPDGSLSVSRYLAECNAVDRAEAEAEERIRIGNTPEPEPDPRIELCTNCGHSHEDHDSDGMGGQCWNGSGHGNRCACTEYAADIHLGQPPYDEDLPETRTIDFTPPGLKTTEGIARTNAALSEWNSSAHEVANFTANLLRARSNGTITGYDWEEIEQAVKTRDVKQEEFLRAVSGTPASS